MKILELEREFLRLRRAILEKEFARMTDRQREAVFQVEGPVLILAVSYTHLDVYKRQEKPSRRKPSVYFVISHHLCVVSYGRYLSVPSIKCKIYFAHKNDYLYNRPVID